MRTKIGRVALLVGMIGIVTETAAAGEGNANLVENGLRPPIVVAPPQNVPVMIAQADQANVPDRAATRAVGICKPAPNNNYSGENGLSPMVSARGYFKLYEQRTVNGPAVTTVVQQPKHGVLRLVTEADRGILFSSSSGPIKPTNPGYVYLPDSNYVGKDNATILVDFGGGNKVKVQYYFQALDEHLGNDWMADYCSEKGPYWKISSTLEIIGGNPRFLLALN